MRAARQGFAAVELAGNSLYLDHPKGPGGGWDPRRSWANFSTYWLDIAPVCTHNESVTDPNATCLAPAGTPEGANRVSNRV